MRIETVNRDLVTLEISQTYKSQSGSMGIEGTCVPNDSETAPAIAVLSPSYVTERLIDVKMLAFACKSIYDPDQMEVTRRA
jgi:hypothetical protein